ncbi:phospholipase D family protein [Coraliomargarita sp. W4R53]
MVKVFFRVFSILLLVSWVSGCASLNFDEERPVSYATLESRQTTLSRQAAEVLPMYETQSAFSPISNGVDALAARIALAEQAELTIDAQYYLLHNDPVGRAFIEVLLEAADRGVRVRLLIDDLETSGMDGLLLELDAHPNLEIRVFNPFVTRFARYWDVLIDFSRVNRRMHNKAFILDNEVAVIGGRNIADVYFGANPDSHFDDMDVLSVGTVVREVSEMFDLYWNSRLAIPIQDVARTFGRGDLSVKLTDLRDDLVRAQKSFLASEYQRDLAARSQGYLLRHPERFIVADYELLFDPPAKGQRERSDEREDVLNAVERYMLDAEKEIYIETAYFVLLPDDVKHFLGMRARGIDVTVMTNSLAANNHAVVHSGYMKNRKKLLSAGVRIFELRPDVELAGTAYLKGRQATATLHSKLFVVDRRYYFIGSFNFDPRSAYLNTESGVILDAPGLARALVEEHIEHAPNEAYELFLNDRNQIRWRTMVNGKEVIYATEPNTSALKRFTTHLMGFLPIMKSL